MSCCPTSSLWESKVFVALWIPEFLCTWHVSARCSHYSVSSEASRSPFRLTPESWHNLACAGVLASNTGMSTLIYYFISPGISFQGDLALFSRKWWSYILDHLRSNFLFSLPSPFILSVQDAFAFSSYSRNLCLWEASDPADYLMEVSLKPCNPWWRKGQARPSGLKADSSLRRSVWAFGSWSGSGVLVGPFS